MDSNNIPLKNVRKVQIKFIETYEIKNYKQLKFSSIQNSALNENDSFYSTAKIILINTLKIANGHNMKKIITINMSKYHYPQSPLC